MVNYASHKVNGHNVFFDFDNTITSYDVLDDIIKRFAVDDRWIGPEEAWRSGSIGSHECLTQQLRSVRVSRERLSKYCARIRLDPYFSKTVALLRQKGVRPVILSDSFTFLIRTILANNRIKGVDICANSIRFRNDRMIPSFPRARGVCYKCGHCKTDYIKRKRKECRPIVYVGDGKSDMCAVQYADMVLAKEPLLGFCRKHNIPSTGFHGWKDVYKFFRGGIDGKKDNGGS